MRYRTKGFGLHNRVLMPQPHRRESSGGVTRFFDFDSAELSSFARREIHLVGSYCPRPMPAPSHRRRAERLPPRINVRFWGQMSAYDP
jgi:hypothetical protein